MDLRGGVKRRLGKGKTYRRISRKSRRKSSRKSIRRIFKTSRRIQLPKKLQISNFRKTSSLELQALEIIGDMNNKSHLENYLQLFNQQFHWFFENMTQDEAYVLDGWLAGKALSINSYLRNPDMLAEDSKLHEVKTSIQTLDVLFSKLPKTQQSQTLYRVIRSTSLEPQDVVKSVAYSSTTMDYEFLFQFSDSIAKATLLTIQVPEGCRVLCVPAAVQAAKLKGFKTKMYDNWDIPYIFDKEYKQYEVILPRNSTFDIITRDKYNYEVQLNC